MLETRTPLLKRMDQTRAPVDELCLVTPFPAVRATSEVVQFSALTAGVPAVLHLFTG